MTLKYLLRKEFTQIRRNSFLPRLIIIYPIVIMCVMPWIMNMEVKNIAVDVVDNDRSTQSQQLVHEIEANKYFVFHGQQPTYAAALNNIEHSETDIAVVIPQNYSRDLTLGRMPQVLIAANAVNGTKGSIGSVYLSQVVSANALPSAAAIQSKVATLYLYNKHLNFKLFMIPALFAIIMMLMTGFLPTLNIVNEKETGTIEQMNVTPVSKWTFILAKLIPYWLIAFFIITVCLVLAWAVYGITSVGNIALIYLLAMLLALFFSSFGLIISNYSDTMQQAIFVMWFFVVILLLLSGLFTPTRSMPSVPYLTTYINPVSYFIEAIRTVFIRGGSFNSIAHQIFALSGIALFMGGWAVMSYKKNN
ncbi:ABC transporter permease [Prevotella intermedia]|uniref:ABC transporter permease n=1 Tax=Prevotella intermedia TaxID=28131 RepID=A0A2D3LHY5_PREIN|nr:ABC transporter permease [Prevotella intermedia]ATV30010.1 ABC transporter permease [Prevotella intermedia]PJI22186.1 ABC transporter permease [Prevotella intermedia]